MSSLNEDFRSAAVAATRHELGITTPDAVACSMKSACIDLPPDMRIDVGGTVRMMKVKLAVGAMFLLLAIACVILALTGHLGFKVLFWVGAGPCIVAAVAFAFWAADEETRLARQIRPLPMPEAQRLYQETVGIESSADADKFHLLAADVGRLYYDTEQRRLLIEGTTHRYCLCAADIMDMQKGTVRVSSGIRIDVRVGSAVLSMVVSARKDLFDNNDPSLTLDPKSYFFHRLSAALGRETLSDTTMKIP